ncbi:hypothetical protein GGR54DRAFT_632629 [Hypoxylon sp. NC1633]|nr:hypothetical protein GGR54DRAFT_632629 [Hypoxylon sp. NC1633]
MSRSQHLTLRPDDNTNVDITLPEYVRAILPGGRNPTRLHLGMHVHDLRYTVIVEYNSDNLPLIALYDGPNTNGQLLGLVNKPRDSAVFWKHTNEITAVHMYQPNLSETFTMSSFMKPSYRFSTRVGLGEDEHYEKFQWRPTKGKEIEKFFMYPKGFKLVRQEAVGPSGGEGGSRKEREEGETSDGKEIVAVWVTENKLLPKVIDQECRAFKFELYGSAKTGELGHHLPYAALMSALKIWVDGN